MLNIDCQNIALRDWNPIRVTLAQCKLRLFYAKDLAGTGFRVNSRIKGNQFKSSYSGTYHLGLAQMVATYPGMNPGSWSNERKVELSGMVELYFPAPFELYLEIRKRYIENPKLDITKGS